MTRLVLSAALLTMFATAAPARAQEVGPEIGTAVQCAKVDGGGTLCTERPDLLHDLIDAAAEADVPVLDLAGAVNTLQAAGIDVTPRDYLKAEQERLTSPAGAVDGAWGASPSPGAGHLARVRLTYYVEAGVTYSGQQTRPGTAACSWDMPMGSTITFRDGERLTCTDRGRLGASGWVDAWRRPDLAAKYGPWADVRVLP